MAAASPDLRQRDVRRFQGLPDCSLFPRQNAHGPFGGVTEAYLDLDFKVPPITAKGPKHNVHSPLGGPIYRGSGRLGPSGTMSSPGPCAGILLRSSGHGLLSVMVCHVKEPC